MVNEKYEEIRSELPPTILGDHRFIFVEDHYEGRMFADDGTVMNEYFYEVSVSVEEKASALSEILKATRCPMSEVDFRRIVGLYEVFDEINRDMDKIQSVISLWRG